MRNLHLLGAAACLWPSLASSIVIERTARNGVQHSQTVIETLSVESGPEAEDVWDIFVVRKQLSKALETMQMEFFQVWLGQWPTSIDWTGAVLGTHVSATLNILSKSVEYSMHQDPASNDSCALDHQLIEGQINTYFSQVTTYYFGEDYFGIRLQAHDDMLWVSLGWLESLKFIDSHNALHHSSGSESRKTSSAEPSRPWHGTLFTPAFAHRSHVFYDLVSRAWDRSLCGGGLTWNPRLEVYKNTVTNTQFISAAVGMYLYHPGDNNSSPVLSHHAPNPLTDNDDFRLSPAHPHDPALLSIAQEAHAWLTHMNMTNAAGLYTDGYHLRSHPDPDTYHPVYEACDLRNEMIYTYNQGILLSGLRHLWEATANTSYLTDAHALVSNVISATGWPGTATPWRGLGYDGFLTEFCDPRGGCSQDAHAFKGIFFHHLALLCEPLPTDEPAVRGVGHVASPELAALHAKTCRGYVTWVEHNARGAWGTRNERGVMGTWWGAPRSDDGRDIVLAELPEGADDWRNRNALYELVDGVEVGERGWDWNDRGRGRTVESHSGGLGVLRALYALHVYYD